MAFWNTLRDQLTALWSRWSVGQRIGISLAALACAAIMITTFMWATQPDFVVLADHLPPAVASDIITALESEQITVSLNYNGTGVSVPRGDLNRAKLAIRDIWQADNTGVAPVESGLSGFPGSPRQEEDQRQRELEYRLAKSIEQIRGVKSARVHISRPDSSPFVTEKFPAAASVIIEPTPGGLFNTSVADSIALHVARAVEGLDISNVSIMDTAGRQYSIRDGIESTMAMQLDYQARQEMRLAEKATSVLEMSLGPGRAAVRVTADVDFSEVTRTEMTFNPDVKVKRKEQTETTSSNGAVPIPYGPPGAAINTLPGAAEEGLTGTTYKHERNEADYDNGRIDETVRSIPGGIKRLTVSAVVDLTPPSGEGGTAGAPPMTLEQAEQLVRTAVGFDALRGDEVSVIQATLEGIPTMVEEVVPVPFWVEYEDLIHSLLLGLSASLAFIIGVLIVRRMKPVIMTAPQEEPMSLADMQRMRLITEQARENPELVAKILAAWLEDSEQKPSETEAPAKSRQPSARKAA
ncbi:MAG: flagellar M-ring protein FliF [Planctomycetaceae bacterium]|nr:flagellar M-ring protein FliF [Planctomycetaceae bacterium]